MEEAGLSTGSGERLGRYVVIKHLASGGMADVLLARASGIEGFERQVVLKRIRAEHARDETFIRMFLDEARLAASLHHQNVIQVNDVGEERGEYFFAMEYVRGHDLRGVLQRVVRTQTPVPIQHVVAIGSAVAAGLHYAHDKKGAGGIPLGIVHRDVSPSNVLVGFDGAVKVVDFGIAKATARTAETRSGTLKGKVAYMSPEQCTGGVVDRRSDIWGIGVVLYELATATRLFTGDTDYITMNRIVAGEIPSPAKRRADMPPALVKVIHRALQVDPERRFQTAAELRQALDRIAVELSAVSSPSSLADWIEDLFGDDSIAEPELIALGSSRPDIATRTSLGRPQRPYDTSPTRTPVRAATPPPVATGLTRGQKLIAGAAIAAIVAGMIGIVVGVRSSDPAPVAGPPPTVTPIDPVPAPEPAPIATAPTPTPTPPPAPTHAAPERREPGLTKRTIPRHDPPLVASSGVRTTTPAPITTSPADPPPATPSPTPALTAPPDPLPAPAPAPAPAAAAAAPAATAADAPAATAAAAPAAAAAATPIPAPPTAPPAVAKTTSPAVIPISTVQRVAAQYEAALSKKCESKEPLVGEVTVHMQVDARGTVTRTQVSSTIGKPKISACIAVQVRTWKFPARPGQPTASATYSVVFQ